MFAVKIQKLISHSRHPTMTWAYEPQHIWPSMCVKVETFTARFRLVWFSSWLSTKSNRWPMSTDQRERHSSKCARTQTTTDETARFSHAADSRTDAPSGLSVDCASPEHTDAEQWPKSSFTNEKPRNSSCVMLLTIAESIGVSVGCSAVNCRSKLDASVRDFCKICKINRHNWCW